jgi:hypothetical protein
MVLGALGLGFVLLPGQARAQYGGILPMQPTGHGSYATVPFGTPAGNPHPLGAFTGGVYGGAYQQGVAVGLYKSASAIDPAVIRRAGRMTQPYSGYGYLRRRPKAVSRVQAFLIQHQMR